MNSRKITDLNEVEQIYREHITVDFPVTERPPLPFFVKMIKSSTSSIYIYEKDGKEAAYAVFSEADGYVLLNFFAVYGNQRGNGIGSELLGEFRKLYADKKGILLEVEHTAYAADEADEVIRRKRIAFYERCGYVCLNNFDLLLFGEHYHVMVQAISENKSGDREYMFDTLCHMYSNIPDEYASGAIQLAD